MPAQLNVLRCCPQTRRGIVVRYPQTVCRVPFSPAHRLRADMQDNQSVAVADPTERVVKAIVYIHDCEPGGGANVSGCFLDWTACRLASLSSIVLQGAVVGTHRLPYGIAEVYGKQFYNGNEVRPSTPAPAFSLVRRRRAVCTTGDARRQVAAVDSPAEPRRLCGARRLGCHLRHRGMAHRPPQRFRLRAPERHPLLHA